MLDATLPIVKDLVREAAHPLTGSQTDYDDLLEFIGNARLVYSAKQPMEPMSFIESEHVSRNA